MNDWHLDVALARGRVADRLADANHRRLAAGAPEGRRPLRVQLRLNLEISFGGGGQTDPVTATGARY